MRNLLISIIGVLVGFALNAEAKDLSSFVINGSALTDSQIAAMGEIPDTCTVTLIGPKVILTAAHCARAGNQKVVFANAKEKVYQATYTIDPLDGGGRLNIPDDFATPHDIAFGVLDSEIKGVDPISVTSATPAKGDTILFAGRGGPDYTRRYGFAKVVTVSSIGFTLRGFGDIPQVAYDGDSGGPNFLVDANGYVSIFAATSTSTLNKDLTDELNWSEALPYTMGVSRLFTTASEPAFIETFIKQTGARICGVNLECKGVMRP